MQSYWRIFIKGELYWANCGWGATFRLCSTLRLHWSLKVCTFLKEFPWWKHFLTLTFPLWQFKMDSCYNSCLLTFFMKVFHIHTLHIERWTPIIVLFFWGFFSFTPDHKGMHENTFLQTDVTCEECPQHLSMGPLTVSKDLLNWIHFWWKKNKL